MMIRSKSKQGRTRQGAVRSGVRHKRTPSSIDPRRSLGGRLTLFLALAVLIGVATWAYWSSVVGLIAAWRSSDDYSAGQLVPLVAAFFVWRERQQLRQCGLNPCFGVGILLLVLTQVIRMYGLLSYRFSIDRYSLVLTLSALVLLIAGRRVLRVLSWILLFMFLMFPLPGRVHSAVSDPLQRLATVGSVFLLEATGVPADRLGNIVVINDSVQIAVAEACSGLRMLTAFTIVAAFVAYMVNRTRTQKAVLVAFSIPVAVICNMIRIFLTAMVMLHVSVEVGEKFFHDFAGLVMMPAAVMLMFGLLWLMDRLTIRETVAPQSGLVVRAGLPKRTDAAPACQQRKSSHH